LKAQQDKFVKDKLLNEILQEIADENDETGKTSSQEEKNPYSNKKLSKKKNIQKTRQRVIIALLVILIIFVLFNPNEETSDMNILDDKKSMYSIPIANQIPAEDEQDKKEILAKEEPMIKISESAPKIDTKSIPEPTTEDTKVLTVEEPKTTREKAKDLLMQQMQN